MTILTTLKKIKCHSSNSYDDKTIMLRAITILYLFIFFCQSGYTRYRCFTSHTHKIKVTITQIHTNKHKSLTHYKYLLWFSYQHFAKRSQNIELENLSNFKNQDSFWYQSIKAINNFSYTKILMLRQYLFAFVNRGMFYKVVITNISLPLPSHCIKTPSTWSSRRIWGISSTSFTDMLYCWWNN